MRCLALVALLAACSGSPPPPSSPPPSNTPPPETHGSAQPPAALDIAQLGQPCGAACVAPATCVEFYGIAGPRGPKFSSCEVKCTEKSACPEGTKCVIVADGPGSVCRR